VARAAAVHQRARLKYLLFRLAAAVIPRLPRPVLLLLSYVAGSLTYALTPSARVAVERNLAVAFPGLDRQTRRRLVQRTFVHGAFGYVELFSLAQATPQELQASYHIDGWENLDAAIAAGRGAIMVTCHAGAPTMAGQLIGLSGVPTTLAVELLTPPAVHELIADLRGGLGVRIVSVGPATARALISALRRNELVGIVADRDIAGSGTELPFFGKPTRVTTAVATLAVRTGAVVLPAFAARTALLEGTGRIESPVEMPRTGDTTDDIRDGTLRILARIEAFIRSHPEQWAVFDEIWPENRADRG